MFTEPGDLTQAVIADALHDLWGFAVSSLEFQPVGFGSYHWLATDSAGRRLYATADDLDAKRRTAHDTTDDAFGRLCRAFGTALSLQVEAGLSFVIGPRLTAAGKVAARLSDRYSLVTHPYIIGTVAGEDGRFTNDGDRRAVVDMLMQIHRAHVGTPAVDDFLVPNLDGLQAMLRNSGEWHGGPYAQRAQELLRAHAEDMRVLIAEYRDLARSVAAQPGRMVITHGEPHAANVMTTSAGLVLIDWDTALLAPPERDLWDLACDDVSLLNHYATGAGIAIDDAALSFYRLWYDLSEIGGYLSLFQSPHEDTEDTKESWKNLQHFLRPAERWPTLVQGSG